MGLVIYRPIQVCPLEFVNKGRILTIVQLCEIQYVNKQTPFHDAGLLS